MPSQRYVRGLVIEKGGEGGFGLVYLSLYVLSTRDWHRRLLGAPSGAMCVLIPRADLHRFFTFFCLEVSPNDGRIDKESEIVANRMYPDLRMHLRIVCVRNDIRGKQRFKESFFQLRIFFFACYIRKDKIIHSNYGFCGYCEPIPVDSILSINYCKLEKLIKYHTLIKKQNDNT